MAGLIKWIAGWDRDVKILMVIPTCIGLWLTYSVWSTCPPKTPEAQLMSATRQFHTALAIYASDHDDLLPPDMSRKAILSDLAPILGKQLLGSTYIADSSYLFNSRIAGKRLDEQNGEWLSVCSHPEIDQLVVTYSDLTAKAYPASEALKTLGSTSSQEYQ
ncbi:MAG: hypothetical protein KDC26_06190 [Armatimonadetes bacterium]|nr:hypothetical protein [Armatimonadota bacterium]